MSLEINCNREIQASKLAVFFQSQPPGYLDRFHPFPFEEAHLSNRLKTAKRDAYFCLEWNREIVGLAMLRGLDAGYQVPSFGVVVGFDFQRRGLGRLALKFCESACRLDGISEIFLKVYPENVSAKALYESEGFVQTGICPDTGQFEMRKRLNLGETGLRS